MNSYLDIIAKSVENGDDKQVSKIVKEALMSGMQPIDILSNGLVPGI